MMVMTHLFYFLSMWSEFEMKSVLAQRSEEEASIEEKKTTSPVKEKAEIPWDLKIRKINSRDQAISGTNLINAFDYATVYNFFVI